MTKLISLIVTDQAVSHAQPCMHECFKDRAIHTYMHTLTMYINYYRTSDKVYDMLQILESSILATVLFLFIYSTILLFTLLL